MITAKIGATCKYVLDMLVRGFAAIGLNPNILTFIGFGINVLAAYLFATGYFPWAGVTIILAGIFDMSDGRVARLQGRVTPFGGFYDSVMDRYSDLCLLIGLLIYYGRIDRFFYVSLVAVATFLHLGDAVLDPLEQSMLIDPQLDHAIEGNAVLGEHPVERLGLRHRSRESRRG